MGVFKRNLTSKLLEMVLKRTLSQTCGTKKILELGCGDGNISRALARQFPENQYFQSDVSEDAVSLAEISCPPELRENFHFRVSNGLEDWEGERFDVVLCDISAIKQEIAELSEWYEGVSCSTGSDGLAIISSVVLNVGSHLTNPGYFIIPSISLSNTEKLTGQLRDSFTTVELMASQEWPMPIDLVEKIQSAQIPGEGTDWSIHKKFGITLARTEVYRCNA
jgi:methylase of polypeptide subunit release factors